MLTAAEDADRGPGRTRAEPDAARLREHTMTRRRDAVLHALDLGLEHALDEVHEHWRLAEVPPLEA